MVTYEIRGPDGKNYRIDGPEGASKEQIVSAIQAKLESKKTAREEEEAAKKVEAPKAEPETGFTAAVRSGFVRLLSDVEAMKAAGNVEGAEKKAKELREEAARIYKQPELLDAPWEYIKGLAGQSLPYMVAPVAAAAAATVAAPTAIAGLAATGAAFTASALQFSGSNLSRQLEENVAAKDLKVLNAVAASVPQAALDTLSLRMVPGLRNVFAKAGINLSEKEAAQIAKESIVGRVAKSSGAEGLTEAAQQVFERAQAGLSLTDQKARKEYFDNFIGGAILGGGIAVPGAAYEKMKAQDKVLAKEAEDARKAAEEEAAKISQTAVPDESGNVPPPAPLPSFETRPPITAAPEADIDPTIALTQAAAAPVEAAPAKPAEAAPEAAPAPRGLSDVEIEDAYAATGVNTEKVRKTLEPQLIEAGFDTKEKQREFLRGKQTELGIPRFDPNASKEVQEQQREAKKSWIETHTAKKQAEVTNVSQPTGTDAATAEPSVVSPPPELGATPGGAEALTTAGVVPVGGPVTEPVVAEGAQPAALTPEAQTELIALQTEIDRLKEGEPSVPETPQAEQAEAQRQEEAAPAPVNQEVLRLAYEDQAKAAADLGFEAPSWDQLTEAERAALAEEVQAERATKGMLPAKGGAKVGFLSPAMAAIIKSRIDQKIDSGEIDLNKVPEEVIDLYESERKEWGKRNGVRTVAWNSPDFSADEKAIYLNNIGSVTPSSVSEVSKALDVLSDYREAKLKGIAPRGASFYEINKDAYNRDLPEWEELRPSEREAFLKAIEPGLGAPKAKPKVSTEQMDAGFKAVVEQVNKRLEEKARKETEKAEEQKGKAQRVAREEAAAAKEEVEVGAELPPLIKALLGKGGVKEALQYIMSKAKGVRINKKGRKLGSVRVAEARYAALTRGIFKNVAAALYKIDFSGSSVVVDPNNAVIKQLIREGKLAAYDPKTDTFYFTKDGMDEMTVLHEIVHAGTIKILHAFKTNPNSLTREQREAAEQINKVYEFAKKKLEGKYANQLENVYEFVSYALTDPRFQEELSRIQAPSLARYTKAPLGAPSGFNMQTIWSHLTKAMMKLYDLTKAATRFFEIKPDLYDQVSKAFGGERYTKQKLEINKGVQREVAVYLETEDKKRGELSPGVRLTFESVRNLKDDVQERLEENYPDAFEDTSDQGVLDFINKYLKDKAFAEEVDKTTADIYKQGKVGLSKQAGYQGNALLEVTQAFQNILAAPEAGIDLEALPAKQPKPAIPAPAGGSTNINELRDSIPSPSFNARQVAKTFSLSKFTEAAVRIFQNDRAAIKNWQRRMWLTGRLVAYSTGFNNIYDQLTLSSGNAHWLYTQYVQEHNEAVREAVAEYAKTRKLDMDTALKELGMFAVALHEPERREVLYLRTVDLSDKPILIDKATKTPISPREARDAIFKYLDSNKLTLADAKYLRKALEDIVNDKTNLDSTVSPTLLDRDDQKYAVAGYTSTQVKAMIANYNQHKAAADKVLDKLKAVNEATLELNKMANYMSAYANNYLMFYGFNSYVPFKGKNFNEDKADMFNHDGRKLGGDFQEQQHTFEGRLTVPDNPILQVMADGAKAAMRAGRRDVTQAIYNAVKEKSLDGDIVEEVDFKDRANDDLLQRLKGDTKVFHYMPDGKVAIIQINDTQQREAIRRTYRDTNPWLDFMVNTMNNLTGRIGQMHTRFKPSFAPVNFVRDVLTNAWTIGAEGKGLLGPLQSFRYLSSVALNIVKGDLIRSWRAAALYSQGKTGVLERLAKSNPYYKDVLDYYESGGRVSYIQGIAPKGQLDLLLKAPGGKIDVSGVTRLFDIWVDTFETASRVAAFRLTKSNEMAKLSKQGGLSKKEIEEAATKTAAAFAKNLANFEQVGEAGRALGSMFMFYRPSATGAVRAMDAVAPAFRNKESVKQSLPEYARAAQIRHELGKNPTAKKEAELKAELATLEKALATFDKNYGQLQTSSRIMVGALAGAGITLYLMAQASSDDDELGRNRVSTDDMARWTKFARLHLPGFDNPIQLPWGFGLGAFAALGSQLAALTDSENPTKPTEIFGNMVDIVSDSFIPLPFSRIPLTEDPGRKALDSVLPSVLRPLFEYYMNMDALGHQIYNNRQSRFGDAYTGGDNIPEAFKDAAIYLAESTNGKINWSPNVMYFFFNNYIDGISSLINSPYNMALWMSGSKDFNSHTDTMIFDSFFGSRSNFDARQWSKIEKDLEQRAEKVNMFKNDPAKYYEYLAENPFDAMLVKMYNGDANKRLKDLREEANKWRTMKGLDVKTRTELVKNAVLQQNILKYNLVQKYKAFGVEP
jgi:hypothetical protein